MATARSGDQQQIAIGEDQREAAGAAEWFLVRRRGRCRRGRAAAVALNQPRQPRAHHEQHRAGDQQPRGADVFDDLPGAKRADPRAETAADADQREDALALFLRVEIGGERPVLRDHHQVEDAEPQEIRHADAPAGADGNQEQHQVRREEQRHPLHELNAVDARCEGAVRRHQHQQQDAPGRPTNNSSPPRRPR